MGPHLGQEQQDPLPGQKILGIGHDPQMGQHVLDVGQLVKTDAAVFHIGQMGGPQLVLQVKGIAARAEEHRHLGGRGALLQEGLDILHHQLGLAPLVAGAHQLGAGAAQKPR